MMPVGGNGGSFSIRSYRPGDEEALVRLFNHCTVGFFGPSPVVAESWGEQFSSQSWTAPSVNADADCARLAERRGEPIGYAITNYQPAGLGGGALIQELCVPGGEDAREVAEALIEDAEQRAKERGRSFIAIEPAPEAGCMVHVAAARGYHVAPEGPEVFMAVIADLSEFMSEIAPELGRRLEESEFGNWRGALRVASMTNECEGQSCELDIADGSVDVRRTAEAREVFVTVAAEALPLLLMGRRSAEELYLQNALGVSSEGVADVLQLLNVLFPRVPVFLPRAQWW